MQKAPGFIPGLFCHGARASAFCTGQADTRSVEGVRDILRLVILWALFDLEGDVEGLRESLDSGFHVMPFHHAGDT